MTNLLNHTTAAGGQPDAATAQPLPRSSRLPSWALPVMIGLWLCLAAGGMHLLFRYMSQPGGDRRAPATWPSESQIPRGGVKPTLLMFVHPHCSCSDASLTQLETVLERNPGQFSAVIAFTRPPGATKEWSKTALWRRAIANPSLRVVADHDGVEAVRFGASTSGRTLLYSLDGHLLFDGGVTAARGETGENPGCAALNALLAGADPATNRTPVFGCPLLNVQARGELPALAGHPSPTLSE
jgi:hypothetical protein